MSDLTELFERDPRKLTSDDIRTIIARMREAQAQFELGAPKPVAERKKKSPAGAALLKELGLGE